MEATNEKRDVEIDNPTTYLLSTSGSGLSTRSARAGSNLSAFTLSRVVDRQNPDKWHGPIEMHGSIRRPVNGAFNSESGFMLPLGIDCITAVFGYELKFSPSGRDGVCAVDVGWVKFA